MLSGLADENASVFPVASSEMALRFVRRCWGGFVMRQFRLWKILSSISPSWTPVSELTSSKTLSFQPEFHKPQPENGPKVLAGKAVASAY
jgi:hypothetical protein